MVSFGVRGNGSSAGCIVDSFPLKRLSRRIPRLADALPLQDMDQRSCQDAQVKPHRLIVHIPGVQCELLFPGAVSYTHLRAHETKANLVCRLLLEKKKK